MCLAHLSRYLNYLAQKYGGTQWAADFRKLLFDAIGIVKQGSPEKYGTERAEIVERLQRLLEATGRKAQRTQHILPAHVQGKAEPVHFPLPTGSPARQQRFRASRAQREDKTENIGTIQKNGDGTELRQDQVGYRYHDQKRLERIGRPVTYR
jgi:hypothetical protein